jgi:CO/xanthine dehydrogenase Mo-binding subunit
VAISTCSPTARTAARAAPAKTPTSRTGDDALSYHHSRWCQGVAIHVRRDRARERAHRRDRRVVDIDRASGQVTARRFVAVDDCGSIISLAPALLEEIKLRRRR